MNKTMLEKRIEERAEERFNREFNELVNYINNHPIGRKLRVCIDGETSIPFVNFGSNCGLLNRNGIENKNSDYTNLKKVREQIIEEYTKEITDEMIDKLDSISFLFNNH